MFVRAEINGLPLTSLLDTGASHSCCRSTLWDELKSRGATVAPMSARVIEASNTAEVVGVAFVTLSLGSREVKTPLYLVKNLKNPLILGLNTLRPLGVQVDLSENKVFIKGGKQDSALETIHVYKDSEGMNLSVNSIALEIDLEPPAPPLPEENLVEDLVFSHSDITIERAAQFNSLLKQWRLSFATSLGKTTQGQLTLYLDDSLPPIKQRYIRMSPKDQEIAHREVDRLLAEGVIEPSESPWSSPAFIIKRKDGRPRLVVDYRQLNARCKSNAAPLPAIADTLDSLKNSRWVSSLDLANAYNLFPMAPESIEKTAFTIQNKGIFNFRMCPFGLKSAPNCFQQLIERILQPVLYKSAVVFLDDILIYSLTWEDHVKAVNEVLKLLREAELRINWSKSQFLQERVLFLGYVVGQGELKVNPAKVEAVNSMARPRTLRQLRSFLAVIGWFRRFVSDLATKQEPLQVMLKEGKRLHWTAERNATFEGLKKDLTQAPTLSLPDFRYPFEVHTDGSAVGISGVLMQRINGQLKVVAYCSRTLSPAERNYTVTEIECLAVIVALEKWRPFVGGSRTAVFSDHASLQWLTNIKNPTGRLARWVLRLSQFDLEMHHIKGADNLLPDLLSRNPYENDEDDKEEQLHVAAFSFAETEDPWFLELKSKVISKPSHYPAFTVQMDGQLYKRIRDPVTKKEELRLVLPTEHRLRVLQECHDAPGAAHLGVKKTCDRISRQFYFPKLREAVKKYVQKCTLCQQFKAPPNGNVGLMAVHDHPIRPMRVVAMDIVGPLPPSGSNRWKYVLVIVCMATKWVIAQPLREATSKAVINVIEEHIMPNHGMPEIALMDNGTCFTSKEFKLYLKTHYVKQHLLPTYFPAANMCERVNRVLKTAIAMFAKSHKQWAANLSYLVYALRTSPSETTGFTPAKLIYGEEMRPLFDPNPISWSGGSTEFDPEVQDSGVMADRKAIWEKAREATKKAKEAQQKQYNLRRRSADYVVGDLVWLKGFPRSSKINAEAAKLFAKFRGPYKIKQLHSESQVQLMDLEGRDSGRHHVSHLKRAWLDLPEPVAKCLNIVLPVRKSSDISPGKECVVMG